MTRLIGLLIIIRTIAPVIVVVAIALTVLGIIDDTRAAVAAPLAAINTRAEAIQDAVDEASGAFEDVQDSVGAVVQRVSQLPNLIPDINPRITIPAIDLPQPPPIPVPTIGVTTVSISYPSSISWNTTSILGVTVPVGINVNWSSFSLPSISVGSTNRTFTLPDIPAFNVQIPGMQIVEDALDGITVVFDEVGAAFEDISALSDVLNTVPEQVAALVDDAEAMLDGVREVGGQWGARVRLLVTVTLVVLAAVYISTFLEGIARGWRMLRGLPA